MSNKGLHGKYYGLRRTRDDSEVEGWYFVIRESDPCAEDVLLAYADHPNCSAELASDLRKVVESWRLMHALYDSRWER